MLDLKVKNNKDKRKVCDGRSNFLIASIPLKDHDINQV